MEAAAPSTATAVSAAPSREWSLTRLTIGGVLAAWASLFWFVQLSGRADLFLSPRTSWVIPVGAVLLTAATIARLLSARSPTPEPLRRREAVILALFTLPVALVLILPTQTLGAFAVTRRPVFGSGVSSSAEDISTGTLTMLEVAGAQSTRKGLDALQSRAGERVSFVGFVTRDDSTPANEFFLNRFIITCCAADAQGAYIRTVEVPPGQFAQNDWVRVSGTIYPLGRDVIIVADQVAAVPEPEQPYLTP